MGWEYLLEILTTFTMQNLWMLHYLFFSYEIVSSLCYSWAYCGLQSIFWEIKWNHEYSSKIGIGQDHIRQDHNLSVYTGQPKKSMFGGCVKYGNVKM